MNYYSFYDLSTGAFTGQCFIGAAEYLELNTPPGCGAVAGCQDRNCTRVDVATGEVVDWQPPAPADTEDETFSWLSDAKRWIATPTLSRMERDAHARIDEAAGACRLRFITDVPGQQAVYMMKLQEATALLANPGAHAPHIAMEAAATGATPAQTAQNIVERAELWNAVLSPAIEAARIGGKAAVTAAKEAGQREALEAACEAALQALAGIGNST